MCIGRNNDQAGTTVVPDLKNLDSFSRHIEQDADRCGIQDGTEGLILICASVN